jgi:predicted negative regulator of RcsB-dependent stress response
VAKRHLTRKEIKQPDQFVSSSARIMEWAKCHVNYLFYGMFGIIILIGLLVAWSAWQKQRQQQAEKLLYDAVKSLSLGGSPKGSTPSQALTHLQYIAEKFNSTPAAAFAYWYLGHLHFEQKNYAAALAAYHQAQRRFSHQHDLLMPILVTLNIGYTQEVAGLYDEAIGSFEQVLRSSASWLRGETFLGIGRCYEQKGAIVQAIATYERALSDSAVDSATRQKIEGQLTRLRSTQGHTK